MKSNFYILSVNKTSCNHILLYVVIKHYSVIASPVGLPYWFTYDIGLPNLGSLCNLDPFTIASFNYPLRVLLTYLSTSFVPCLSYRESKQERDPSYRLLPKAYKTWS